jgi:hypothetical protein
MIFPMKKILIILFFPVVLLSSHLLYLYTHREFTPTDFKGNFVRGFEEKGYAPDAQVIKALAQSYTYLGHGKQMTAFESADHQYVIKFINPRPVLKENVFHKIKGLKRLCSLKWFSSAYFKKNERLTKLFKRYQVAFQELKEESGLVYIRLDPSISLPQEMDLIEKEGKHHRLPLKDCPFVLQKKAIVATKLFQQLSENGDQEGLKKCGEQLFDLFLSRAKKGYTDRIQTLHNNYGFVDGKAIQIDLGRIWKDEEVENMPKKEMERIVTNVTKSPSCPSQVGNSLQESFIALTTESESLQLQ